MVYYQSCRREDTEAKLRTKKLKKLSKNLLTNGSVCDIIYRLPTREDSTVFAKAKPGKAH